jgi:hypothetical protein
MRVAALLCFLGLAVASPALARAPGSPPTDTAPCSREATRAAVHSFFDAFEAGDFARLDSLFAPEPAFQWYSTPAPGRRQREASQRRNTLIPYLRRRHAKGDRLHLDAFHWTGRSPHWSNFWFEAQRSAPAVEKGRWFSADGKGAAVCDGGAAQLIVLTFGERAASR